MNCLTHSTPVQEDCKGARDILCGKSSDSHQTWQNVPPAGEESFTSPYQLQWEAGKLRMYIEMVTKLFLLQFVLFVRYFVKLAQNDFRRSRATPQSFYWLSSSRTKSPKFRLKIVL